MNFILKFVRDEKGQDLIEYGLLAGFLSIVAVLTLQAIGPLVEDTFAVIRDALPDGRCCDD